MSAVFLHPRLDADTGAVGETELAWVRWMNDRRFAWVILVPKVPGAREWHELVPEQQHELLELVNRCSQRLQVLTRADKMNLGALGNLVPQLHVHVIARHEGDPCWPGPVWGQGRPEPYAEGEEPDWVQALRDGLGNRCA